MEEDVNQLWLMLCMLLSMVILMSLGLILQNQRVLSLREKLAACLDGLRCQRDIALGLAQSNRELHAKLRGQELLAEQLELKLMLQQKWKAK